MEKDFNLNLADKIEDKNSQTEKELESNSNVDENFYSETMKLEDDNHSNADVLNKNEFSDNYFFENNKETILDKIYNIAIESEKNLLYNENYYDSEFENKLKNKKNLEENFKKEFYEYLRNQSKYKF